MCIRDRAQHFSNASCSPNISGGLPDKTFAHHAGSLWKKITAPRTKVDVGSGKVRTLSDGFELLRAIFSPAFDQNFAVYVG